MRLVYHPDAEFELTQAAAFYERQVPGLGHSFMRAFNLAIARIEARPEWGATVEDGIRRRSMPRFPYAIYYRVVDDELKILVLKHNSRHPDYWRYRTGD